MWFWPRAQDKRDLASDIISSYINIDVNALADLRHYDQMYKLMRLLAGRCCSRLEYVKLSKMSWMSRVTVQNYIDFLEKTYIIARVPVLARNPDREIVKAKKLYFCDNGILNSLENVSGGVKFENAVYAQMRDKGHLAYYSLKTGREIDLILNKETACEIKESPVDTDRFSLNEFAKRAGFKSSCLIGRYAVPRFTEYTWAGDIL